MKKAYYNSKLQNYFADDDYFESFQIVAGIENLAKFRDDKLSSI